MYIMKRIALVLLDFNVIGKGSMAINRTFNLFKYQYKWKTFQANWLRFSNIRWYCSFGIFLRLSLLVVMVVVIIVIVACVGDFAYSRRLWWNNSRNENISYLLRVSLILTIARKCFPSSDWHLVLCVCSMLPPMRWFAWRMSRHFIMNPTATWTVGQPHARMHRSMGIPFRCVRNFSQQHQFH